MINVILLGVILLFAVMLDGKMFEWCNTECHNAVRIYTGVIFTYNTFLFH